MTAVVRWALAMKEEEEEEEEVTDTVGGLGRISGSMSTPSTTTVSSRNITIREAESNLEDLIWTSQHTIAGYGTAFQHCAREGRDDKFFLSNRVLAPMRFARTYAPYHGCLTPFAREDTDSLVSTLDCCQAHHLP